MKTFLLLFVSVLFSKHLLFAQTTVTFRPDSSNSYDVLLTSYYPNNNYSVSNEFLSAAWTCSGNPCNDRSLIKFDLSIIPINATVLSATISLYAHPNQSSGNAAYGPTYGTNNLSYLRKITSAWSAGTVTWNTQPSATTVNQATLPTSTNTHQDYLNIDVKNMVQGMVNNPSTNYGFILQLQNEVPYNCMIFCSSEFSDSTKRPMLEVTYSTQNVTCISIRPDSTNGVDTYLDNYYPNINYGGNSTEIISEAWTCNGDTCNFRSLIKFDLTSIPTTSTVTYATISFYAHPNQINGNPVYGPVYGTSNTSFLRRVTSPWAENTVTWNTQPTVTTIDQATLPQSISNYQDYPNIDVTNITQNMVSNPVSNYGFMIQLQNEIFYNCMIFCSSDFADTTKHPELYVCYTNNVFVHESAPVLNYFSISPNPPANNISVEFGLSRNAEIRYGVFNSEGQKLYFINAGRFSAGNHWFDLSGEILKMPSGIYFFRFEADDTVVNRKIAVIH